MGINFINILSNDNEIYNKPIDIRFIEWMPFYNNKWNNNRLVTYNDMIYKIEKYYNTKLIQLPTTTKNDTTKWYTLPNGFINNNRRIGFITSVSNHFCNTCNRLRITADGQLKVCLFGTEEINLRHILRNSNSNNSDSDDDDDEDYLKLIIEASVKNKYYSLGGYKNGQEIADMNMNRSVTLIGG